MLDYFEKKIELFPKTVGAIIAIIFAISLLIRLYYLPYDVPLTLELIDIILTLLKPASLRCRLISSGK